MEEVKFVIKTFVFTVLVLFALQIKVGPRTIENHATNWMRGSNAVMALRGVAGGAVAFSETAVDWMKETWETRVSGKSAPHKANWRKEIQSTEADVD